MKERLQIKPLSSSQYDEKALYDIMGMDTHGLPKSIRILKNDAQEILKTKWKEEDDRCEAFKSLLNHYWRVYVEGEPLCYLYPYRFIEANKYVFSLIVWLPGPNNYNYSAGLCEYSFDASDWHAGRLLEFEEITKNDMLSEAQAACERTLYERLQKLTTRGVIDTDGKPTGHSEDEYWKKHNESIKAMWKNGMCN